MKRLFLRSIPGVFLAAALVLAGDGCSLMHRRSVYSSIHQLSRNGDLDAVVAELARNPGALNLPDDGGQTPLHLAAGRCHTNVMALLIQRGAKLNVTANGGATPLHVAAQEGCADGVRLLLSKKAKVNPRDDLERTPLARAKQWHRDGTAEILRQIGGVE